MQNVLYILLARHHQLPFQRLEDAERAFDQLLRLDADCVEAKMARQRVMAKQLMKLGFSAEQSEAAALHYNNVKTAAESLTATRCKSISTVLRSANQMHGNFGIHEK